MALRGVFRLSGSVAAGGLAAFDLPFERSPVKDCAGAGESTASIRPEMQISRLVGLRIESISLLQISGSGPRLQHDRPAGSITAVQSFFRCPLNNLFPDTYRYLIKLPV